MAVLLVQNPLLSLLSSSSVGTPPATLALILPGCSSWSHTVTLLVTTGGKDAKKILTRISVLKMSTSLGVQGVE